MKDQLTGLPQELYVKNKYKDYIKNSNAYMIAIDFAKLKYINDNFGHEEGNNSLKVFSRLASEYFYDSMVCRFHGDEFYILTCVETEEIKKRLEMIKNEISKIHERGEVKFPFSFNCGIKRCEKNYLITKEKADYAMYTAKRAEEIYSDFSDEDFCTKLEEEKFIKEIDKLCKTKKEVLHFNFQVIKNMVDETDTMTEVYARNKNDEKMFDYNKYRLLRRNYRMKQVDLKITNELFSKYEREDFDSFPIVLNFNHQTVLAREFLFEEYITNLLNNKGIAPCEVILSINILEYEGNISLLSEKIKTLRKIGFKICGDDLNISTSQNFLKIIYEADLDYIKFRNITLFRAMNNEKSKIILESFIFIIKKLNITPIFTKIEVPELIEYIEKLCPEAMIKGNYVSEEKSFKKTF